MRVRSKTMSVLLAVVSAVGLTVAMSGTAAADDCQTEASRNFLYGNGNGKQARISLIRCAWDGESRLTYQGAVNGANVGDEATYGDSIKLAYKPYYDKGFVPGSFKFTNSQGYQVTNLYYGNRGELQACADIHLERGGWEMVCTW